eukprot:COSAG01_NODE_17879_length_1117_cov_1.065815_3_plen_101_part_01
MVHDQHGIAGSNFDKRGAWPHVPVLSLHAPFALRSGSPHSGRVVTKTVLVARMRVLSWPVRPTGPHWSAQAMLVVQESLHVVVAASHQADVAAPRFPHVAQ